MGKLGTAPSHLLRAADDPALRSTVGALLRRLGRRVEEAASGPAGLALLQQTPVDLVLTDLRMPGLTRWEVARLAKGLHPGLPVVLVTGSAATLPPDQPGRQCVDAILAKPCGVANLQAVLGALFAVRVAAACGGGPRGSFRSISARGAHAHCRTASR
jgi:CheY-like chemotaxis protein